MNVDHQGDPQRATTPAHDLMRARILVEESREIVVVIDTTQHVVVASRRAREAIAGLAEGSLLPAHILEGSRGYVPYLVPYDLDGRSETLVYLSKPGDLAAYQELREGFTASVSHELRTPLARLLALLESAELAGADIPELVSRAHNEVEEIGELIDDVLFLSELESGKEIVSLGTSRAAPVLIETAGELAESAERAGLEIVIECDEDTELPLRPRMIRVIARNLIENAIRYAGPDTTLTLSAGQDAQGRADLIARDNGTGVAEHELPRLFERFYRADRSRSSRGTGLGLAITKHIVTAANGTVQATASEDGGLTVRCEFARPKN